MKGGGDIGVRSGIGIVLSLLVGGDGWMGVSRMGWDVNQ